MAATSENRDTSKLKRLVLSGTDEELKDNSIHSGRNLLWDIPGLDIYSTPVCRMHNTDHGIFPLVLDLCVSYLKVKGELTQFDSRWQQVGSFPGLKRFVHGE